MTTDKLNAQAARMAERINGGKFDDPRFYTEEQRELWRGHARELMNEPLVYGANNEFLCTPEHAVGEAYLLSCAEAAINRTPRDRYEIGHLLANYCAGDLTLEEALIEINEDCEEAEGETDDT